MSMKCLVFSLLHSKETEILYVDRKSKDEDYPPLESSEYAYLWYLNTTNTTTYTLDRSDGSYNITVGSNDSITINWNIPTTPSTTSSITFTNFVKDTTNTYTYTISIDATNNFTAISSTPKNIVSGEVQIGLSLNLFLISNVWTIIPN